MSDANRETELKIPVNDLAPVRKSLQRARAIVIRPTTREINLLLDTDSHRLREAGCVLRLRRHGDRSLLTFKGPVTYRGAVKDRAEYETEVGNFNRTCEIFENLGFKVFMRYEKDREEWTLDDVSVALDRTPMGAFVEVEGRLEKLQEIADLLGLKTTTAVRGSYVSLWLEHRTRHPELDLPLDMVFEK